MQCLQPIVIKNPCLTSEEVNVFNSSSSVAARYPYIEVPCGSCYACQVNKQNSWVVRIAKQIEYDKWPAFFSTLTYTDENLPMTDSGLPTLVKQDLQLFFKRFDRNLEYWLCKNEIGNLLYDIKTHKPVRELDHRPVRFGVGEYGHESGRPHYHFILFNIPPYIQDYLKHIIAKSWNYGDLDIQTIKISDDRLIYYITKYLQKKQIDDLYLWPSKLEKMMLYRPKMYEKELRELYENRGNYQLPPFNLPSRRPPIGANWLKSMTEEEKIYFRNHSVINCLGKKVVLPRYYREKLLDTWERSEDFLDSLQKKSLLTRDDWKKSVTKSKNKLIFAAYKEKRKNLF